MGNGLLRGIAIGVVVVVAACGGGGSAGAPAASTAPSEPAATTAPSDAGAGAESAAAATAEASTQPAVTEPPAGGGTIAGDVCALVTPEEVAAVFGVSGVTLTVLAGPPDNCIVASDAGDPLGAWSLMTAQAATVYGAMTTDPSTVEVPGIGDKAAIVQNTGLMVLKGGNLLTVSISGGADMSEEAGIEAAKRIATFAAGRL